MKKVLILVAVLFSIGTYAQENNFKLTGNFPNLNADFMVLEKEDGDKLVEIAKSTCKDGKFVLKGYIKYENEYSLKAVKKGKDDIYVAVLVEKRPIEYSGEFTEYPIFTVKGSKYAHKFFSYCKDPKYLELRKQHLALKKDNSDEGKLKIQEIEEELYPYIGGVDYRWYDEAHPKHQFHLADQYYHEKKIDKFIEQAKKAIEMWPDHPSADRINFILKLETDPEFKRQVYASPESRIGTQMIDVVLKDIDGKQVKLSEVVKKNKFVLLDFWASWCGPCRAEFPHLRIAYKEFKKKGFEIVSVSLDKKPEAWKKAGEKENIPWIDLNQSEEDHTYDQDYGVQGIPYNVLIGANGVIVGENLRGEELEATLKEKL